MAILSGLKRRGTFCEARSLLLGSLLAALTCLPNLAQAALPCSYTYECEATLRVGSQCVNGKCTNPYHNKGCLAQRLPDWHRIRVCHSEDPPEAELLGHCRPPDPDLNYNEIRISTQNWESAFFQSWIVQIVLSEMLGIPVTLEPGTADDELDFYHLESPLGYGISYDYEALHRGNEVKDCRLVDRFDEFGNLQTCAHVLTEVWYGNHEKTRTLWEDGVIDRPDQMGALGYQGIFIPGFTAESDPTLLSHLGMKGEENRRKLAETFLRPTTWSDYCTQVSPTNCTQPDSTATRAPKDEAETSRYFFEGEYTGYFRATEKNDCDANPTTCTGEIIDYPCGWTSFVKQQMFHLNIALESSGKELGSNGYSYSEMVDVYSAANATKSNVMLRWWTPEALYQTYLGTPMEFQGVYMPPPTQDCVRARVNMDYRCEENTTKELLFGTATGSCNEPPFSVQRLLVQSLKDSADDPQVPEETRSPAYETIKNIKLDELQLGKIFDHWLKRGRDKWNFDPRDASCRWVAENIDLIISTFVPKTYPRVIVDQGYGDTPLFYISMALSLLALGSVVMAAVGVKLNFKKRAIRYSQIEFLYILLVGLFMVAFASVLLNLPISDASCTSINWFSLLGYSLELVPLILKVTAIAHITAAAKKFRRIELNKRKLFKYVFALGGAMVILLAIWTGVDPTTKRAEFELTKETTDVGDSVILRSYYCSSDNEVWTYISSGWHGLLLLCGTILAFQTRNIRKEVNESLALAVLVYSHTIFAALRVILYYLEDQFEVWALPHYESMIYSVDVIAAICIYFLPKILVAEHREPRMFANIPVMRQMSRLFSSLAGGSSLRRSSMRHSFIGILAADLVMDDDDAQDDKSREDPTEAPTTSQIHSSGPSRLEDSMNVIYESSFSQHEFPLRSSVSEIFDNSSGDWRSKSESHLFGSSPTRPQEEKMDSLQDLKRNVSSSYLSRVNALANEMAGESLGSDASGLTPVKERDSEFDDNDDDGETGDAIEPSKARRHTWQPEGMERQHTDKLASDETSL